MNILYIHSVNLIGLLTSNLEEFDAQYPETVAKTDLLQQIVPLLTNENSKELAKINIYDILWNLSNGYVQYKHTYGDDEDEDDDENEDDDIKQNKEKIKEICTKHYDWITKYHQSCNKLILELFDEKYLQEIQNGVDNLSNTISNDMNGKLKETQNGETDKNQETKKNQKKKVRNKAVTTDDMDKWSKMKDDLCDKIKTRRIALNLLTKIFDSDDIMIPKKENENKNNDENEEENEEEMDEEERKRKKKTILSSKCRNDICGIIIDNWIDTHFNVNKLFEITENIGLEMQLEIGDTLKNLKNELLTLVSQFMTESVIVISQSQWQTLWNFGNEFIKIDNEKSKTDIPKRQKRVETIKKLANNNDDENKENQEQDVMDDIENGLELNRDDSMIASLMKNAMKQCKDLKVTKDQIDEILILDCRIRNCQESACKFAINLINNKQEEDYIPFDLIYVDDINAFQQDINNILKDLFEMEQVKSNKDLQRSILTSMYQDIEELAKNGVFIDSLIKYYNEKQEGFDDKLLNWNGINSMQIGFDTTQLILDIMTKDQYAKLSMNKRKFESILKTYKKVQDDWNKLQIIVKEYNKIVNDKNDKLQENKKKQDKKKDNDGNNDEEEEEEEEEDQDEYLSEIDLDDVINKPLKECIINIEKFLEQQK